MIVGVLGQRGTGKSTTLRRTIRAQARVIVFDPLGEHGDCGIVCDSLRSFRGYWRARWAAPRWHIILQPHELRGTVGRAAGPAAALRPYLELVRDHAKGCYVVLDEAGHWGDSQSTDPRVQELTYYGRHRDVSLVWAVRHPSEAPKALMKEADCLYLFRLTEDCDLDKVRGRVGRAVCARLPALPNHTALVWRPGEPVATWRTEAGL